MRGVVLSGLVAVSAALDARGGTQRCLRPSVCDSRLCAAVHAAVCLCVFLSVFECVLCDFQESAARKSCVRKWNSVLRVCVWQ